jgi:hypothetical protein
MISPVRGAPVVPHSEGSRPRCALSRCASNIRQHVDRWSRLVNDPGNAGGAAGLVGQMQFLLKAISFGTTRYPERVARRLRVINILAYSSIVLVGQFAIRRLIDPTPGMWEAGLTALVVVFLAAMVPLLHRFGPSVARFGSPGSPAPAAATGSAIS